MPKAPWWLAGLLVLGGCASEGLVPKAPEQVSPEADLGAPGMIPPECETLLQKSQEWGYRPGERWRAASDEQALAVAEFFSTFYLVPENTARYFRTWLMEAAPANENEAKQRLDLLARAQSCDSNLAMGFLDGLIEHRWATAAARKTAGDSLLRFVLNQQTRSALLVSRAVSVHVAERAKGKRLISGPVAPVRNIRAKMEKDRAAIQSVVSPESTALELERVTRREIALSDTIRDQLSRYLPLP